MTIYIFGKLKKVEKWKCF